MLPVIFAFAVSMCIGESPARADTAEVGTADETHGVVKAKDPKGKERRIGDGDILRLKDEIRTGAKGFLKMTFKDDTSFIMGARTRIVLDDYVYQEDPIDGKISILANQGVFRFKTGKIVEKNPENMQIQMPVGIIGVRGTQAAGETDGEKSMVVLEKITERNGRKVHVVLQNKTGGTLKETPLSKEGFGSSVQKGQPPSDPFKVPEADRQRLDDKLTPPDDGSKLPTGFDSLKEEEFSGRPTPTGRDVEIGTTDVQSSSDDSEPII